MPGELLTFGCVATLYIRFLCLEYSGGRVFSLGITHQASVGHLCEQNTAHSLRHRFTCFGSRQFTSTDVTEDREAEFKRVV